MKDLNTTLSALDVALAEDPNDGPPQANEFTTRDYMQKTGLAHSGATKRLHAMVQRGTLVVRKGRVENERRGNIYGLP